MKDAKLSGGDLHFSQGDGEITFCGAIEMGGFVDFHVDLIKGGMETYGISTNPVFMPGNVEPRYSDFLTFIGISVDQDTDTNYYLDATMAYRRACLNAVEYLKRFGYSGEQAYLLLGSAPIEGRISGIVDIPNACCSLYLPTAMFDFDVRPSSAVLCAPTAARRPSPAPDPSPIAAPLLPPPFQAWAVGVNGARVCRCLPPDRPCRAEDSPWSRRSDGLGGSEGNNRWTAQDTRSAGRCSPGASWSPQARSRRARRRPSRRAR